MQRIRTICLLCIGLLIGLGGVARAAEIAIACSGLGEELALCKHGVQAWEKATGNTVKIVTTPNSATARLALYEQLLAAGSHAIDVFQVDIVWTGILGPDMIDLGKYVPHSVIAADFPRIVEADMWHGRLVSLPWFTNAGVLYYRRDLLAKYGLTPPQTWEQLGREAAIIQKRQREAGDSRFWGYVFQGQAYEGLTCDALEWVASYGGGTFVAPDGKITADNPNALKAIAWAASTVGTIAPEGVLNYEEEDARGVFQSGNAAFMRNWPYAWALAQSPGSPVRDKVGVEPLPSGTVGGPHVGALGGGNLAVSRFSRHPAEAASLARFMTSYAEQKYRAIHGSFNPTIPALYHDPEVLKASPFFGTLLPTFEGAVARPSAVTGRLYNRAAAAIFDSVHAALAGSLSPRAAVAQMARELERISDNGRW
ncbi:MAG TPA: ABC transporter substrate-binding protein [Acetobacteraceae bacterium]|nr:ABC transporter substrate-binding protein [Acetobacteraceae bacterium]